MIRHKSFAIRTLLLSLCAVLASCNNASAPVIALSPSGPQMVDQGQSMNFTATDSSMQGVNWTLMSFGTLSNITKTSVTYNAPAMVTVVETDHLIATSIKDPKKSVTVAITLEPPPSVTTTSLPTGTVSASYSATLAATNGVTPYTWSVTVGSLPAGLTLAASTGAISGTPTAIGTSNFTVQVKDAGNFTATAALSIKVNPAPLVITTMSLPNAIVNTPNYSANLQSTGGAAPIAWTVSAGSLPTGLALAASGAITGTPTTAGTSNFTVQAADSSTPPMTATMALSITVIPVLSITTSSLPNGITATAYSATLASTGGVAPVGWSVTVGTLPAGLSLNPSTGAITGMPTTAGTSTFTVQAADSGTPQQKATKALSITILQALVITTSSLPTGAVNSTYSATLMSSGGTPSVTWSISAGALPANLILNPATGAITGTPTTAGMFSVTFKATDSGTPPQTPTKQFNIFINPVLAITTTSLPSGTAGTAYSQTLLTNGGGIPPIAWSITLGVLPSGLSLNASTGVISGTPLSAAGSPFNFTVQAADSGTPQQTATQALSISIATAPLSVVTTTLPNGVVGQAYNTSLLSAGGNPPVTWSISSGLLPAWATLNTSTGAITGTPNAAATTTFTVKATDSSTPTPQTVTKQLTIQVNTVLTISTTSLPNGTVGTTYSATLVSSGGATPVTWSISAGALPSWASLNTSTGAITGTPNAPGTTSFTVQATDSTSPTPQTATQALSITVTVAPLIVTSTSGSLPTGTVNFAYPNTPLAASGGIPPYFWSLTGGTFLPTGLSLSTSGQITGTPTASAITTFTVKVTDSAMPANTATAMLSITVNAAPTCVTGGSEALLNGSYAFLLKGFDGSGNPALVGGVLTFSGNGLITAGTIDMNLNAGVMPPLTVTSGSFYGVGSDHRGCMVITTSAGTQQNYRFSLGNISGSPAVASTGHVIDFDPTGPFTAGIMRKQSGAFSSATLNGSYAFGGSSIQNTAVTSNGVAGGKFGVVGVITFNGSGGITGGSEDFNGNGQLDNQPSTTTTWPPSPIPIIGTGGSGTYSVSSNGRGNITIVNTSNTSHTLLYVVSSSEALFMSSDPQTSNAIVAGQALLQTGTPFSPNPLSGTSIGYVSGLVNTAGTSTSKTQLILINASGAGITGTILKNAGGSFSTQSITGTTYSVAPSGRMMLSGAGTNPPIFYVVSPNQVFILDGGNSVGTGFFQSQTGSPFTNTSANGTYAFGVVEPEVASGSVESGVATFTPATTSVSGTSDNNSPGGQNAGKPFGPQTYSIDTTGLGSIPSGCTILPTSTTCQTLFYVISPTKAVVMDVNSTNTNPKIEVADQ